MKNWMVAALMVVFATLAGCNDGGHDGGTTPAPDPQLQDLRAMVDDWRSRQGVEYAYEEDTSDERVFSICAGIEEEVEYAYDEPYLQTSNETLALMKGWADDKAILALVTLLEIGVEKKDMDIVVARATDGGLVYCLVVREKAYFTDPKKMDSREIVCRFARHYFEIAEPGHLLSEYEWGGV